MHEQECEGEPAHHARRPMNAFLIFCKRHRSVVRDKYPNLENRSITKILGEWWANLDKEEKSCYTGLAKQYKDAFFSANPDFKWYKLPAPPLRTLSSRPRETADKFLPQVDSPPNEYQDTEPEKTNNNSTKVDFNKKTEYSLDIEKPLSMFTPGKLADVAQMGGLSSLLAIETEIPTVNPYYSPHTFKFNAISTPEDRSQFKSVSNEDSIRELQNALSETSKIFKEEFDEKGLIYRCGVPNDQFTNQDVIDQIVDKRYSRDDEFSYQRNWSDDEKNKSGRSCKGKRYQEFMAVGGLLVKRQKRDDKTPEEGYSASCSWESSHQQEPNEDSSLIDDPKQIISTSEISAEIEIKNDVIDTQEPDNNSNKTFKAADFDLDAKIRALPSLSLEKFQQKKRENKRKKKSTSVKPRSTDMQITRPPPVDERRELAESWREAVIGSQKRKPRKISITRLEINSMVSSADLQKTQKISPEIKIATEAPVCAVGHNHAAVSHTAVSQDAVDHAAVGHAAVGHAAVGHSSVDLLALATLAEVASNTSRIEDTPLAENASKV